MCLRPDFGRLTARALQQPEGGTHGINFKFCAQFKFIAIVCTIKVLATVTRRRLQPETVTPLAPEKYCAHWHEDNRKSVIGRGHLKCTSRVGYHCLL